MSFSPPGKNIITAPNRDENTMFEKNLIKAAQTSAGRAMCFLSQEAMAGQQGLRNPRYRPITHQPGLL